MREKSFLSATVWSFQEDLKTKEASLQEKEVVIQKLKNNLSNREGELKVREASNAKDFLLYNFS